MSDPSSASTAKQLEKLATTYFDGGVEGERKVNQILDAGTTEKMRVAYQAAFPTGAGRKPAVNRGRKTPAKKGRGKK